MQIVGDVDWVRKDVSDWSTQTATIESASNRIETYFFGKHGRREGLGLGLRVKLRLGLGGYGLVRLRVGVRG